MKISVLKQVGRGFVRVHVFGYEACYTGFHQQTVFNRPINWHQMLLLDNNAL